MIGGCAITDPKQKVLVIGGSIRGNARRDQTIMRLVKEADGLDDLVAACRKKFQNGESILSNSEIFAGVAMLGAKSDGSEVDYFSLRSLFHIDDAPRISHDSKLGLDDDLYFVDTTRIKADKLNILVNKARSASGFVVATPIYFGDRSSLVDSLLKILHDADVLKDKAFSVVSVGAKRNGGQETTNIYALFDALNYGAFCHGNGPKTSQYGGTGWAGDKGAVLEDQFGMETAYGTGRRSSQIAKILKNRPDIANQKKKAKVVILITADNVQKEVEATVRDLLPAADNLGADFEFVNLVDFRIERCLGCRVCPYPPMVQGGSKGSTELGATDYACIIDNGRDGLELIREKMKNMDGLIIAGVNQEKHSSLLDQYQAFTERTRFIRRADFEWMNTPFTSLILKDVGASRERVFGLRAMTSYMRHNMIAMTPVRALYYEDKLISNPIGQLFDFVTMVNRLRLAREASGPTTVSYIAGGTGGYRDTSLDHTSARRI